MQENRHDLESTLVQVKGIVSVVVDVEHQRCSLNMYKWLTPLAIATAVFEETGMEVKLVSRNKYGQEVCT